MSRYLGYALLLIFVCLIPFPFQANQNQTRQPAQTATRPGQEVDPDDVIRINTTMVNSPVLVLGRNGRLVPNLQRDDFVVFEDGVQQTIAHFSNVNVPYTVAIVIDNSRSTASDLEEVQDAAVSFVDNMRMNDRALVVSFSRQIRVLAEPTSDHDVLKRAIRNCRPEGSSSVYDAITFVLTEQLDRIAGRTAMVVFSDGVDNASVHATYESALQLIAKTRTVIFPVQFNTSTEIERQKNAPVGSGFSREDYLRADAFLHQVAVRSGTGVYPAQDISDLERAVSKISDELHNEYSLGYYPSKPMSGDVERRIEVRTRLPQLVVKARTSYSLDPKGAVQRLSKRVDESGLRANGEGSIPVPRTRDEPKLGLNSRWICKSTNSDLGLAVVKEGFVALCPKSDRQTDQTNAWFVRPPGKIETMCKGFMTWQGREIAGAPIPSGYVVTSETTSPLCSKSALPENNRNAWIIQTPDTTNAVCKGFNLPRGYVMVRETALAGCPSKGSNSNAWIIRRK
ncbi:MAG TPA: VWA domain-containing protein [Pyrinomonadaceae bacterium]|jgi:VWFA-related protein